MCKSLRRILFCICILATFLIGFLSGSGRIHVPDRMFCVSFDPDVAEAYGRKLVEMMYAAPVRDVLEQMRSFLETLLN